MHLGSRTTLKRGSRESVRISADQPHFSQGPVVAREVGIDSAQSAPFRGIRLPDFACLIGARFEVCVCTRVRQNLETRIGANQHGSTQFFQGLVVAREVGIDSEQSAPFRGIRVPDFACLIGARVRYSCAPGSRKTCWRFPSALPTFERYPARLRVLPLTKRSIRSTARRRARDAGLVPAMRCDVVDRCEEEAYSSTRATSATS